MIFLGDNLGQRIGVFQAFAGLITEIVEHDTTLRTSLNKSSEQISYLYRDFEKAKSAAAMQQKIQTVNKAEIKRDKKSPRMPHTGASGRATRGL